MAISQNVKIFYSRMQTLLRRRRARKSVLVIVSMTDRQLSFSLQPKLLFRPTNADAQSTPFDFRIQPVNLPGISDHQISAMREQVLSEQLGVWDHDSDAMAASPGSWVGASHRALVPPTVNIIPPSTATSLSSESALSLIRMSWATMLNNGGDGERDSI